MKFITNLFRHRKTVAEAWPLYIQSRVDKNLRPVSLKNYEYLGRWLLKNYGSKRLNQMSNDVLREIANVRSMTAAKNVIAFVRWCKDEDFLPHDFIIKKLPSEPRSDEHSVSYLSPADVRAFMRATPEKWRATFALAIYAGVRPFECHRVRWTDVNVEERRIKIHAAVSKIRRARMIEDLPEVLWNWIEPYERELGLVCPVDRRVEDVINPPWSKIRRKIAKEAGVTLGHDIFRHTFATYYVALMGNPGPAAKVLGHQSLGMLASHYDGVATKADAEEFFDPSFKP